MKSFVIKKIVKWIFFIVLISKNTLSISNYQINSNNEQSSLEMNLNNSVKYDPQLKPNFINSSILINGIKYQAICHCENKQKENRIQSNDLSERLNLTGSCDMSKMNFSTEITGNGASIEAIKSLFGSPQDIAFVKLEDYSFTCIDGRNKSVGISTPGGDAGEFLLALDVYENLLSNKKLLDYNSVEILLKSYLRFMKQLKFKMCTDNKALDFIKNEMMVRYF